MNDLESQVCPLSGSSCIRLQTSASTHPTNVQPRSKFNATMAFLLRLFLFTAMKDGTQYNARAKTANAILIMGWHPFVVIGLSVGPCWKSNSLVANQSSKVFTN